MLPEGHELRPNAWCLPRKREMCGALPSCKYCLTRRHGFTALNRNRVGGMGDFAELPAATDPSVRRSQKQRRAGQGGKMRIEAIVVTVLFVASPAAADDISIERGLRVSIVAGCQECHTEGYLVSEGKI